MKLLNVFQEIRKYPSEFVSAGTGKQFEESIERHIKSSGYTKLPDKPKPENWKDIRETILLKTREYFSDNLYGHNQEFMVTPNGTQDYPDFLIFENKQLICIETKFNVNNTSHPVWNSGLPRPNGIYIIGSYPRKDATFFIGKDVVTSKQAKAFHDFFDRGLPAYKEKFNSYEWKNQKYGFEVYIRKTFQQTKKNNPDAIVDFYQNPHRKKLEENVLKLLSSQ